MIEGYKREPATVRELSEVIYAAMTVFPEQRLGQIIVNAVPFNKDLFNLHDEDLIRYLRAYIENHGKKPK